MKLRFLALGCAAALAAAALPAVAQGLRPAPQLSRPAASLPDSSQRAADYIVAVVTSEPITNYEVRARMVRYEQQLAQQGAPLPPRTQLTREVLDRLVTEKAQLQLARELNVKVDDA